MKFLLAKFAVIVMLIATATAYGQQQGMTFDFFGAGARSEGMGQAFVGVSNDATAGTWNPAGLYIQEKTIAVFGGDYFMPKGEYNLYQNNQLYKSYKHDANSNSLGVFALIAPLRIKGHHFVANLSYTRNFNVHYKYVDTLLNVYSDGGPNVSYERYGGIGSFNIGLGTRIYRNWSFGLMGNIYYGKVITDQYRHFFTERTTLYGTADYVCNARALDSTTFSGFNMTLGLMYNSDPLRWGLIVKTPFSLNGDTDTTYVSIATENGVIIVRDQEMQLFFTDTIYYDNNASKIDIPLMIATGVSYKLKDNWLLAADLEYRRFSSGKVWNFTNIVLTASGQRIVYYTDTLTEPNWNDVIQLRVGTEYTMDTKYGQIPLRLGFRNEAIPEGNIISYHVDYTDVNYQKMFYIFDYDHSKTTGFSLSLGTGIHWSQILLDFAYTYTAYTQKIYADETTNNLRGENKWKNHHLNVTFTGYF